MTQRPRREQAARLTRPDTPRVTCRGQSPVAQERGRASDGPASPRGGTGTSPSRHAAAAAAPASAAAAPGPPPPPHRLASPLFATQRTTKLPRWTSAKGHDMETGGGAGGRAGGRAKGRRRPQSPASSPEVRTVWRDAAPAGITTTRG